MLCPYYDGIAVYFARDIMLDMGYGNIVNDCEVSTKMTSKPFKRLKVTEESEFVVYPNPATNQLNFNYSLEDVEQIEFLLYDVLGKLQLRTKLLAGDQHRINLTDLNKGVYLYRMTNSAKVLKSGKLIIE